MRIDAFPEEPRREGNSGSSGAGPYDVGYGKPPKRTRFKKGKSGNLNGRPKGSRNKPQSIDAVDLNALVIKEAYRLLELREGETTVTVPVVQAVMRSVAVKAATGNQRAALLFTALLGAAEKEQSELKFEFFKTMVEYKERAEEEVARREKLGLPIDDIIPHPDDVIVNPRTGVAKILGPMCEREQEMWDHARDQRARLEEFQKELIEEHEQLSSGKRKKSLLSIIKRLDGRLEALDLVLDPKQLAAKLGI